MSQISMPLVKSTYEGSSSRVKAHARSYQDGWLMIRLKERDDVTLYTYRITLSLANVSWRDDNIIN